MSEKTPAKKSKKKKIIAVVAVIAVIIGGVAGISSAVKGGGEDFSDFSAYTDTYTLTYQDLSDSITFKGTVSSESSTNITSDITSKVLEVNAALGDYVKAGDVLCVLDSSDIESQIESLEKSIKSSNAISENQKKLNQQALQEAKEDRTIQLNEAQKAINSAQNDYDNTYAKYCQSIDNYNAVNQSADEILNKMNNLNPDDFESEEELAEQYEMLNMQYEECLGQAEMYKSEFTAYEEQLPALADAVDSANSSYKAVKRSCDKAVDSCQNTIDMSEYEESDLQSLEEQLDKLYEQLDECTIKADKDGTVTNLEVSEGDVNKGGLLMTIENTSKLKINVSVSEKDILTIKEGMKAIITSSATGDEEIAGTVTKVVRIMSSGGGDAGMGEAISQGGFSAEITIDDPDTDLLIGMNAQAKVLVSENSSSLSLTYDSVTYDEDGNAFVYAAVEQSDGSYIAEKRFVEVSDTGNYYVEYISGDLSEGDIIVNYPDMVSEGETIQVLSYDDGGMMYSDDAVYME